MDLLCRPLSFNDHYLQVVLIGNKTVKVLSLDLISRLKNPYTLPKLYLSLVLPHVEYTSWCHYHLMAKSAIT